MIETLLARAPTRFVFVVGKGGVGKTTTSGAIALTYADRSESTHLISTDPAHSLNDLLPEPCSPNLTVEEFNARMYADAFFEKLHGPFVELIERGTYLDAADAASFLDLSIPGIDEVMSALRLVELLDASAKHVVIDTAPTGHTLRLLDSAAIIESWVNAGYAMAEKASVVSAALVGQPVPLSAVPLLRDWHEAAKRFETEVVRQSSALVVTRAGHVVEAETRRLIDELEARGLAVGATVAVGDGDADFVVDRFDNAAGCDRLRAWRDHIRTGSGSGSGSGPAGTGLGTGLGTGTVTVTVTDVGKWFEELHSKLIWVGGKGGVGKSTCAAAIATTLAEGRKVCVVSTDPAGSLSEVFGVEIGSAVVEVSTNLFARQIDAVTEFERMREQFRNSVNDVFESLGLRESAQLDRRVIESLWDFAPPGIDEIISLIEILEHAGDYATLVIDSAPTGHFLRLIEMPEIALDWVRALLRLLVKYGAAASLDALAQDLLAFAKRLKQLKLDLSTTGDTAVFVVTLDEPLVKAETARLLEALARAGVPVAATILNRAEGGDSARESSPTGEPPERRILAPDLQQEVVGTSALRSFLAQWTFNGG